MGDARNKIQYLEESLDAQQRENKDIEIIHHKEKEAYMNQNEGFREQIASLEENVIFIFMWNYQFTDLLCRFEIETRIPKPR